MPTSIRKSPSGKEVEVTDTPQGFPPSQARYVDYRDTGFSNFPLIPDDQQDGSAAFPFDSLQKAADSFEQTGEPSLIILYPGDTNDQARKDVDLTAFVDVQIKGLNVTGALGFAQVGNISAFGVAHIALEDLEIQSLAADPNGSIVFLRGGGRYIDIVCEYLTFSGQSKANQIGVFAMQIINATVTEQMVGGGAELTPSTAGIIKFHGCNSVGGPVTFTNAVVPSHLTSCDTIAIDGPGGGTLLVDSWSASNLPGFTTISGLVPTIV